MFRCPTLSVPPPFSPLTTSAMDPTLVLLPPPLPPLPPTPPPVAESGVVTPSVLEPLGLCSSSGFGASLTVDRLREGCSTHWARGMPNTAWCEDEDDTEAVPLAGPPAVESRFWPPDSTARVRGR